MAHPYSIAAGAALLMCVSPLTCAYSGDLELGIPALPVMMQFENNETDTGTSPAPADHETHAAAPDASLAVSAKATGDEFQRYFDRHYRAHLVLDAAAQRDSDVK